MPDDQELDNQELDDQELDDQELNLGPRQQYFATNQHCETDSTVALSVLGATAAMGSSRPVRDGFTFDINAITTFPL